MPLLFGIRISFLGAYTALDFTQYIKHKLEHMSNILQNFQVIMWYQPTYNLSDLSQRSVLKSFYGGNLLQLVWEYFMWLKYNQATSTIRDL